MATAIPQGTSTNSQGDRDGVLPDGVVTLKEPKRDFQRLTLDTNTTNRKLSLSENNRTATFRGQDLCPHHPDNFDGSYPDHRDRFDRWPQVLCTESLTGRCYWEVEWSGVESKGRVSIAVTYRGIFRKGYGGDCWLGWNDRSWSLLCIGGDRYGVIHNGKETVLHVSPTYSNRVSRLSSRPVYSGRVAVCLDHPAGTLSFYEVSSDTLTHLHTFQTTFTEPLYAGFWVGADSSVRLCDQG